MSNDPAGAIYRDLLEKLSGEWRFERQAPGLATMTGIAVLTPTGPDLSFYEEQGTLETPQGGSFQFSRKYRYQATPHALEILFDEDPPRLYQSIRLTEADGIWWGTGYHRCVDDNYRSAYAFNLPEGFATSHRVLGPRKDYVIETRYRRMFSPSA